MNKCQLIEELAKSNRLSYKTAESVINTFFDTIAKGFFEGERTEIRGLGSFKVKSYKSYAGRNPKTGEVIQVKPTYMM